MTDTVRLEHEEIQDLYDQIRSLVDQSLRTTDNMGARLKAYASGTHGQTHFSIGIEGVTSMSGTFLRLLEDIAPGAKTSNELLPNGDSKGWVIHIPIIVAARTRDQGRRRPRPLRVLPPRRRATPIAVEWIVLLWMLWAGGVFLLYWRWINGQLY
jgi:hypothetical protein